MQEFSREYFREQNTIFENVLCRVVGGGDRFSVNSVSNICIFMKQFNTMMNGLLKDVESGKIGKTPRKFKNWKKKKMEQQIETTDEEKIKQEENVKIDVDFLDFYK